MGEPNFWQLLCMLQPGGRMEFLTMGGSLSIRIMRFTFEKNVQWHHPCEPVGASGAIWELR